MVAPTLVDEPEARLRAEMEAHPNARYVRVEVIDLRAALDRHRALDRFTDRLASNAVAGVHALCTRTCCCRIGGTE